MIDRGLGHGQDIAARQAPAQRRTQLGTFGFSNIKADTKCSNLSGGEKARLLLALTAFYLHGAGAYWPDALVPAYGRGYEECSPALGRQVAARGLADAVVLVTPPDAFAYSSGFIHLDPFFRSGVLYARGDDRSSACLKAAFPGRPFYRYEAGTGELAPGP